MSKENWQLLQKCSQETEGLDIILACDGAASVGQVGHEVAVKLTRENAEARMCCLAAVGANSKPHIAIAEKSRKLIIINGCQNNCASKIVRDKNIIPSYEITIAKEGVDKVPTLDFDDEDVDRLAKKISEEVSRLPARN